MNRICINIGANYGDEGKGLVTNLLTKEKSIVVMTNGGAQRGHTVENENERYVVHHLSSGLLNYSDIYFSEYFILNSMQFIKEYDEQIKYTSGIHIFRHSNCKFSLPYDMLLNQIKCYSYNRNNSTGMGINETIKRYENTKTYTLDDFARLSEDEYFYYMFSLYQTYYIPIIKSIHLDKKSEELIQFFTDKNFLLHFFEDCKRMAKIVKSSSYFVLKLYSSVVFENGQGLGLDDLIDTEYGTPTRTGITYAQDIIERVFTNETIFVNYITRSYVTRHGEGYLENPYNSNNIDLTNVRNDFQGSLRYGHLDDSTFHRIYNDISIEKLNNKYKNNLIITHYDNNFKLTSDQTRMFYNILGIKDKYGKQEEIIKKKGEMVK